MKFRALFVLILLAAMLRPTPGFSHHAVSAKFDETRRLTLSGIVTLVDWKNPHVHVFLNAKTASGVSNWAVELESPLDLARGGWNSQSIRIGDAITVQGIAARDGSLQIWADSIVMASNGKPVLDVPPLLPPRQSQVQPTPRWPDGQPRLGPPPGRGGYWAYPSATSLVENGVNASTDSHGILRNISDIDKVAPFQRWARDLYEFRQRNFLKDDPLFLFCKPPGGPRQFQLPYGIEFLEDRAFKRIFVLIGSGNRNFRLIYTDGRENKGQPQGDFDNPLFYGRSTGRWEGDTLVMESTGFNEQFWFSNGGLPHTQQLRLTERISRPDFDTLNYEVTIDDPGAYTRSWTSSWTLRWVADEQLPVYFCGENRP